MLSQAHGGACHSHKLEFVVRNAEELQTVEEQLKACDDGTTLHCSGSRLCEHRKTSAQGWVATKFFFYIFYKKPEGFCTFARFARGKITSTLKLFLMQLTVVCVLSENDANCTM